MTLATFYSIALQHVILPPLAVSELAESSPRLSCLLSNITSKWNINRCRWKWDNFINKVVNISSVAAWEAHQKPKSLLDHQCLLPQFFKLSHVKSMFRFPPWTVNTPKSYTDTVVTLFHPHERFHLYNRLYYERLHLHRSRRALTAEVTARWTALTTISNFMR